MQKVSIIKRRINGNLDSKINHINKLLSINSPSFQQNSSIPQKSISKNAISPKITY